MYEQLELTTPEEQGERLKEDALERVEENNRDWVDTAEFVILWLAKERDELTSDDVWDHLHDVPTEPRAMGAAFSRAAGRGAIEATDRTVRSRRPACHRRPVRVWKSLVVEGGR